MAEEVKSLITTLPIKTRHINDYFNVLYMKSFDKKSCLQGRKKHYFSPKTLSSMERNSNDSNEGIIFPLRWLKSEYSYALQQQAHKINKYNIIERMIYNINVYFEIPDRLKPVIKEINYFDCITKNRRVTGGEPGRIRIAKSLIKGKLSIVSMEFRVQLISYLEQKDITQLCKTYNWNFTNWISMIRSKKQIRDDIVKFFKSLQEHDQGIEFDEYVDLWKKDLMKEDLEPFLEELKNDYKTKVKEATK